ncbi:MAG: hypothetical protein QF903_10765 [Planctomycetota bacterium]|nr:hypothetical protein [Planctomycetota bacterium]MDP6764045.1 hypothetical protein [Planctomycetota bacterium]MDP6989950.1 hypothetical protein [Planctomycetota bacterium]
MSDSRPSRWLTRLALAAVGTLLVLVTLSCLRTFARHENQLDALRAAVLLERVVHAGGPEPRSSPPRALGEILPAHPALSRRLNDARILEDGNTLLYHGYLFDLLQTSEGALLRAWPRRHPTTGKDAFLVTPGGILGHPNRAGRWSGTAAPPVPGPSSEGGWRPVPAPAGAGTTY